MCIATSPNKDLKGLDNGNKTCKEYGHNKKKKVKEWESSFGKGVVEELLSKKRNIRERNGDEKEASKLV